MFRVQAQSGEEICWFHSFVELGFDRALGLQLPGFLQLIGLLRLLE